MAGSTALIARRSIRARLGRTIVIGLAVAASVSFVVGSFVLADSLRSTFDELFTELASDIDLEVRSSQAFDGDAGREPIDVAVADRLSAVDGVAIVEPSLERYAQVIEPGGDAFTPQGGPTLGVTWEGNDGIQGVTVKSGRSPSGLDEIALDQATADLIGVETGDRVSYLTDTGRYEATISGTFGLGDTDGFGGASVIALDVDSALERFGSDGKVDAIDIAVADGADVEAVRAAVETVIPAGTEVITGEELAEEEADGVNQFIDVFGTGLLIFAFITAFVAAFIINNIFQITIGQRLRELALLRAVGSSGRQVRRMITAEALGLGVVATVLGIFGGIGVSRLIVAAFNAAGAGFPDAQIILAGRTIIAAVVVGVGITLLSVFVPARRAARIPPVAAMRPELGFAALRSKRLVIGTTLTVVGAVALVIGLFVQPGSTIAWAFLAGVGALVLFLGVASVSAVIAAPMSRILGWPIQKIYKVPGQLARDNVARAPRRTSSSAAALMIGVALVSAAAVFTSSIRATFNDTLENAITADYIVTDPNFFGLSPLVAETLAEVPELDAVTPVRGIGALVDGDQKGFGAVDADAFDRLVNPDLRSGSITGLGLGEALIHTDPARDLDLAVGDSFDVIWENGRSGELTVAGIYGDATFGNWLIGIDTLESVSDAPARDFFIIGKLADGVDATAADTAVRAAMEPFPQAEVETNAEFRASQEAQINQLLVIITILLFAAIILAVIGVAITLALGVFERTREIGLLRAVGMNKRQTRRAVRWEAVIVSTFGAVVGIVLGTFLGVVLSLAVPDDIVDRLAFNPSIIVLILIGAVVAGLLAAIYPSYKASNMDVLEAIATE